MNEPIANIYNPDQAISLWLHERAHPWLDRVMLAITHCGNTEVLIAVTLVVTLIYWLYFHQRRAALTMLLAWGISQGLNELLKRSFQRARPQLWEPFIHYSSYSFPSGHAMNSTAVYCMVAFLLTTAFPRYRRIIWAVLSLLVFMIGLSRIYLGVHWASDVLAGFAAGLIVLYAVIYWYKFGSTDRSYSHSEPR